MASFFKFSCAIYWLCWMGCLTYLLGAAVYGSAYVLSSPESENVFNILKIICLFNMAMAFVGCAFVKCSITHVLCALLFLVPLIVVNLSLCVLGIVAIKVLDPASPERLMENIQSTYNETGDIPEWLHNVQELGCCGIYNFMDYPLRIYNNETLTVPISCCNDTLRIKRKSCPLENDSALNSSTPAADVIHLLPSLVEKCNIQIPDDHQYDNMTLNLREDYSEQIFTCGCHKALYTMAGDLYQAHLVFFIAILVTVLVMAFVYVRVWCKQRGSTLDSGSDHSLDMEEPPSPARPSNVSIKSIKQETAETPPDLERQLSKVASSHSRQNLDSVNSFSHRPTSTSIKANAPVNASSAPKPIVLPQRRMVPSATKVNK